MSCEHLICASCAGPVDEGRCPSCRAARSQLHHSPVAALPPAVVAVAIALLAVMILLLTGR